MRIQTKVALLFTALCMSILIGLSLTVYYFADRRAFADFYTRLELRANIAVRVRFPSAGTDPAAFESIRRQHLQVLPEEQEEIFLTDTVRQLLQREGWNKKTSAFYEGILRDGAASMRDGDRYTRGIRYSDGGRSYVVVLSAMHGEARDFLASLSRILWITNTASMFVVFGLGLFFSHRMLAPIRRITRTVKSINATSLHRRVPESKGSDEITELANTFNDLIARLETAFETQRNFVSNASHELNTPLTALMGEAELALLRERSAAEYKASLQVVLQQAARLNGITRSLLLLAQSGYRDKLVFESVPVAQMIEDSLSIARSIYPDCPLRADLSLLPEAPSFRIRGERRLLELCLSNLVNNACKYAEGKEVVVAAAATATHLVLLVRDRGIGIPEPDLPHVFEPFFRASNAPQEKGYGIGLPLAQTIVQLHRGTIEVRSRERQGTEVVLRLPR